MDAAALRCPARPRTGRGRLARARLVSFDEVPSYLQDNAFILGAYRPPTQLSAASVALTLFAWHNETLNIWTHLCGAAAFCALLARTPRWEQRAFQGAAVLCLASSALFHLAGFVSRGAHAALIRLDFAGIAAVMAAMYVPFVALAFPGSPAARHGYLGGAGLVAAATLALAFDPRFPARARPALFALQGLASLAPIAHAARAGALPAAALLFTLTNHAVQALGACLYAFRVPERFRPGAFDVLGGSHTLFHACTVAGLLSFDHALRLMAAAEAAAASRQLPREFLPRP